jgi:hypothetical protein
VAVAAKVAVAVHHHPPAAARTATAASSRLAEPSRTP